MFTQGNRRELRPKIWPEFENEFLIFGLAFSYPNFESLRAKEGKTGDPHDLVCGFFRGIRIDAPHKIWGSYLCLHRGIRQSFWLKFGPEFEKEFLILDWLSCPTNRLSYLNFESLH